MSVTQISPGVYRHAQTGFVVHEVYNTKQLLDCNGVLCEYGHGGWVWLAGRDLKDYLSVRSVNSLLDLATQLARDNNAMAAVTIYGKGNNSSSTYFGNFCATVFNGQPLATNGGTYTRADSAPGTMSIYGLVNNCHAGHGRGGGKWSQPPAQAMTFDFNAAVFQLAVPALKFRTHCGPMAYNNSWRLANDAGTLLGTVVIAVPLGITWDKLMSDIIGKLPHGDRSEVQSKAQEEMGKVLPAIKAVTPLPYCYVPVEVYSDGSFAVVHPRAPTRYPKAANVNATPYSDSFCHVMRGGIMFDEYGIARTTGAWYCPTMRYGSDQWSNGLHHSMLDITGNQPSNVDNNPVYNFKGTYSSPVDLIDGVRLERVLGGIAGKRMPGVGEAILPANAVNLSSSSLVDMWRGAMRFKGASTMFNRATNAGTGLPETDAEYTNRVVGLAETTPYESASEIRLTQWDHHGFTAGHGLITLVAALDGGKTDGNWLHEVWPARVAFGYNFRDNYSLSPGTGGVSSAVAMPAVAALV